MEPTLVNLDHPQHRHRVQKQAAHGRPMEEEVRTILRSVLSQPAPATGLGSRLNARFLAMRIQEPCSDRARLQCGVGADAVRARSGGAGEEHCGPRVGQALVRRSASGHGRCPDCCQLLGPQCPPGHTQCAAV